MAVQARHLFHAFFPHDLHAILDEHGWSAPAAAPGGDFPRSELPCNYYGFQPRKRPRVAVALPQVAQPGQMAGDVQGRMTASTSGRPINGDAVSQSQGLLSRLCRHHDVEMDALLTRESERMRAVLEDARRRHARALLAAVERAASARLRAAEAELERALRRNTELEEKARQMGAECQAWMGVATSHEAVAAGLRATLDQLILQSPPHPAIRAGGEGDAEDAQSCCFEAPAADADDASRWKTAAPCRSCGGGEACVLVLPCRHLCLCRECEAAVDVCPVCAAAKNASLHVLFS